MNKILTTLFIGLMLTVGGTIANAGPYEDGLAAFKHRDFATAKRLLRPFAEQGSAEAQHKLGEMYEGAPQNLAEAEKWYKRAADQGHVLAQVGLGLMYSRSEKWNAPEAMKWFRLAAEKGYAPAQRWLGNRYRNGWNRDVPQNYAAMLHWYEKAAEQGDAEAQYQLGVVFRNGEGVPQNEAEAMKWFRLSGYPIPKQDQFSASATSVPMQREGGVYVVPVLINDAITLNFVVDSGASDVTIPADVVTTLIRTGTLKSADFLGERTYVLADGTRVPSQTFRIRSLRVGNRVIENVNGSVASVQGSLLLGQSFLSRFKSWSIDNNKHALVFE